MPEKETTVTIIGAGIIGGAIAETLAPHFKVIATRRKIHKLNGLEEKGVEVSQNNKEAAQKGDIIILSVKPSQVISVLKEIKEEARGKVIISFAAAIPTELMKKVASDSKIVRAMTNTAVKVRKGYTLYTHSDELEEREVALLCSIFSKLGEKQKVDENHMDVLTAMSGSGPAYIFTVVEAMIYGALREGLPRALALQAAAHTAIGASCLLLESGKHPAELRDMVLTPGGVTIDGIYELEESRIRTAFMKAISAASSRARVLSEEVRKQAKEEIER